MNMDKEIAKNIFNWKYVKDGAPNHWSCGTKDAWILPNGELLCPRCQPPPAYSTNIADAWLMVEKMKEESCWFDLYYDGTLWHCQISTLQGGDYNAEADTAPMAIGLAALSVMTKEEGV